jgi:hypothetical protein
MRVKHTPCKKCKKGYGSDYDGLCTRCRGRTSFEQKLKDGVACETPWRKWK